MAEKGILFKGEMVRALLNTKPGTWPPEPIEPSKPSKWQTRRIVKPAKSQDWLTPEALGEVVQMVDRGEGWWAMSVDDRPPGPHGTCPGHIGSVRAPYQVGDILWVRETILYGDASQAWSYAADGLALDARDRLKHKPCPSLFMPRWAIRITLEVMEVRCQRVQDITEGDAIAEGTPKPGWNVPMDAIWCPKCKGQGLIDLGPTEVDCGECDTHVKLFRNLWGGINGLESWPASPWVWAYSFRRLT